MVSTRSLEFTSELNELEKRDKSFVFSGLISTREYHGLDVDPLFKKYLNTWVNKEVRWRHEDDAELFIGEVKSVWNTNGFYFAKFEIFGDHEIQQQIQEAILKSVNEEKPIGLSTHYIVYYNDDGKPVSVYNRELSITPTPKCEECRVEEHINEDKKMSTEDKNEPNSWKDLAQDTVTMLKNEAEGLRTELTEKGVLIEELDAKVKKSENEKKEFVAKISELEEQVKTLETERDTAKTELEEQTVTMPIVTELLTLEGITDEEMKKQAIATYKTMDENSLKFLLDQAKARAEAKAKDEKKDGVETTPASGGEPQAEGTEPIKSEATPEEYAEAMAKKHGYDLK